MPIRNVLFFLFVLFITIPACDNNTDQQQNEVSENEEEDQASSNLYTIKIEGNPLKVEIVQTEEARMQGLMFRDKLPENQGMLFAFSSQRVLSFWMRNTFIPLEIAFINKEGVVVDIQFMKPLDDSVNYVSAAPALYALEVNPGWFDRHGIKVGSKVEF